MQDIKVEFNKEMVILKQTNKNKQNSGNKKLHDKHDDGIDWEGGKNIRAWK